MKGLKRYILDIVFSCRCKYCRNVIDIRDEICHTCANTLQKIEGKICNKCGCKVDSCVCDNEIRFYKSICAPFYYEGAASRAIWKLKFNNDTGVAEILSEDMANCFYERYGEYSFDICTFVPSTEKRQKERGYNQSELIAQALSKKIGVECKSLLIKSFETEPQHKLSGVRRIGNIVGCFDIKDDVTIENTRILLCDDVKTTGSTINECAKTLLLGGAAEVFCITAAITGKKDEKTVAD